MTKIYKGDRKDEKDLKSTNGKCKKVHKNEKNTNSFQKKLSKI